MHPNLDMPIGIFDSGIGGLTVANAISHLLPNEKLVYFGDTAHFPYGEKSQESIRKYAIEISDFLYHDKKCKAIVIACNTASAAAYLELKEAFNQKIPIINVIDPMVELLVNSNFNNIGIIATRGTIASGVYQEKITRRKKEQKFAALATPLLASMIEEHFLNNQISHAIIQNYLEDPILNQIDALVLACTHYPLIENEISRFYNPPITILNSARVVANKLALILEKEALKQNQNVTPLHEFFVSELTQNFNESTQIFFGKQIELKEIKLNF
jgi:glutamate racemase